MSDTFTINLDGDPVIINVGENTAEAMRQAQLAEQYATLAVQASNATISASWSDLFAVEGAPGDSAIIFEDSGTHTDPVVGGTVANAGIYLWSASPAGWERVAYTEAARADAFANQASGYADDAAAAKTGAEDAQGLAEDARDATLAAKSDAEQAAVDAGDVVQAVSDALAVGTISDLVGTRIYASRSALEADLVPADNEYALVVGDATAANNDLYQKNGATTTGSWDGPLGIFAAASAEAQAYAGAAELAASYAVVDDVARNTSMGASALGGSVSITDTTAMGEQAGASATTAASNTLLGSIAGREITTGGFNTAVGHLALSGATNPTYNVAIGYSALTGGGDGVGNVAVGASALAAYASATGGATAIGNSSLVQATGVRNTAVGESAGSRITTGAGNIFVGWGAGSSGSQSQTVNSSIVIGYNSASDSDGQIVIGDGTQDILKMFGITLARYYSTAHNLAIGGAGSSPSIWTGQYNLAIGEGAMANATTAASSVAIGPFALEAITTSNQNVAVGGAAMRFSQTVADSTAVGSGAGEAAVSGVGMTAIGHRALAKATIARNCTGVGDSALWMDQGSRNIAMGYVVAEYIASGNDGVYLGTAAGRNRLDGDRNILIGAAAGAIASAVVDPDDGVGAVAVGDRNLGIGYHALLESLGSDHVALGDSAGKSLTGGDSCIFIGSGAGNNASQKVDASGSIVIGAGAYATRDDEIVIGKSIDTHLTLAGVTFTKAQIEALLALVTP